MPRNSNHQIDWVVNRNYIADELCVDFESPDEAFANARNEALKEN